MSADDSSRLASDPPPTDEDDKVEPTVRDALIGAAIGLLLIYAGTHISYWVLKWRPYEIVEKRNSDSLHRADLEIRGTALTETSRGDIGAATAKNDKSGRALK